MADDTRLWQVLEPYLAAEGVELDDLEVRGRGRGRMLRVVVDADGGVGMDRIAELSRGLSRLLDEADPIDDSYTLEVTSPGLERRLRRPAHYRKAVGRDVVITTSEPIDGSTSHRGVVAEADDDAVAVDVEGALRRIPLASVAKARTVFRWESAPKPGRK